MKIILTLDGNYERLVQSVVTLEFAREPNHEHLWPNLQEDLRMIQCCNLKHGTTFCTYKHIQVMILKFLLGFPENICEY